MSIATQLTALAANRDAIKAAIEAKGVADAGDTLAEFPAAIASIPSGGGGGNELEPYPWVGSGTHAWLHYDAQSRSHVCCIEIVYYGSIEIDWGDGSQKVNLTNGNATTSQQTHEYANGDFRLDITGDIPLEFGHWDNATSSYKNQGGRGFINDDTIPMTYTDRSCIAIVRDALVQFETDSPSIVGGGSPTNSQIGATRNCRWMKFSKATEISCWPISVSLGVIGVFAPKVERMFYWGHNQAVFKNTKIIDCPKLQYLYSRGGGDAVDLFNGLYGLEEFVIPYELNSIPNNFLMNAASLGKITFATDEQTPSSVRQLTIGQNFLYRAECLDELILPEGFGVVNGESFAFMRSLRKLDLPSTFQSATNTYAFRGTTNLEELICRATTPPTIGSGFFLNHRPNAKIYIPNGTTAAYTAATNWSQYSSYFVELNPDGTKPSA